MVWWCYPTPSEGRSAEFARQSRRRWARFCSSWPQALRQEELSFRIILHGIRRQMKAVIMVAKSWQFIAVWAGSASLSEETDYQGNLAKDIFVREISFPAGVAELCFSYNFKTVVKLFVNSLLLPTGFLVYRCKYSWKEICCNLLTHST